MNFKGMLPRFGDKNNSEPNQCSASAKLAVRPVEAIPLKHIRKRGHNMRPNISDEDRDHWSLMHSIRKDGLLNPVIVYRPDPSRPDEFELVAGYRRLAACEQLDHKTIAAVIYEAAEVATLFYVENEQREPLHPIVRAWSTAKMFQDMGLTQEQLAERLGCERCDVTDDLAISKLPRDVRERVLEANEVVARSILVEIAQCDDLAMQREMTKLALAGASRATIRKAGIAHKARTKVTVKRALAAAVTSARSIADKLDRADLASGSDDEKMRVAELKIVVTDVAVRIADIETKWATVHAADAPPQSAA